MTCPHLLINLQSHSSVSISLWSRWLISLRTVWSELIEAFSPVLINNPWLQKNIKDFSDMQLVPELPDKRLYISMLPRTSGLEVATHGFGIAGIVE